MTRITNYSGIIYPAGSKGWEIALELLDKQANRLAPSFFINRFRKLYGYSCIWDRHTFWLGIPAAKTPTDFWVYQEIIWETRPQFIITGVHSQIPSPDFIGALLFQRSLNI